MELFVEKKYRISFEDEGYILDKETYYAEGPGNHEEYSEVWNKGIGQFAVFYRSSYGEKDVPEDKTFDTLEEARSEALYYAVQTFKERFVNKPVVEKITDFYPYSTGTIKKGEIKSEFYYQNRLLVASIAHLPVDNNYYVVVAKDGYKVDWEGKATTIEDARYVVGRELGGI